MTMFGSLSTVMFAIFTNIERAAKRNMAITLAETTIHFVISLVGNMLAVKPLRFRVPDGLKETTRSSQEIMLMCL